jgi:hypothetical protein
MSFSSNQIPNLFSKKNSEPSNNSTDKKEEYHYINEISLHNDDDGQSFCDVATSAIVTIKQASGNIVFSAEMKSPDEKSSTLSVRMANILVLKKQEDFDTDDLACARKGFITPVSLPAHIIVSGTMQDRWADTSNLRGFKYELTVDAIHFASISEGHLNLSFNKGICLRSKPTAPSIKNSK